MAAAAAGSGEQSLKGLLSRSKQWQRLMPTKNNRLHNLIQRKQISESDVFEFGRKSRPILHFRVYKLLSRFLQHKQVHGSSVEKSLYKDMKVRHPSRTLCLFRRISSIMCGCE